MAEKKLTNNNEMWQQSMMVGHLPTHIERYLYHLLPSDPRCSVCKAPFEGFGGGVLKKIFHISRSSMNPTLCNMCEHVMREHPGGAEVELTMMFADVRGSTRIAQTMSPAVFSQLMDRFYSTATTVIVKTDGLIEKFVGDEATVWYVQGFAGEHYTRKAVEAAKLLLEATGHRDPNGPWLPLGVGIHHGIAYIGVVGSEGVAQLTSLGDTPNTTSRLASVAGVGEILISDVAFARAEQDQGALEHRDLDLKGRADPLGVHVLNVMPAVTPA